MSHSDCSATVPTRPVGGTDCATISDKVPLATVVPPPNDQPGMDVVSEVRTGHHNMQSITLSSDDNHTPNLDNTPVDPDIIPEPLEGPTNILQEQQQVRVLPPRTNRGIPPERYSPEKTSRTCRYPLKHLGSGVSNIAQGFFSTICSEEIPKDVQEALKRPEWKAAMMNEMRALQKSETWEKCIRPPGKRPVGCKRCLRLSIRQTGVWKDTRRDL